MKKISSLRRLVNLNKRFLEGAKVRREGKTKGGNSILVFEKNGQKVAEILYNGSEAVISDLIE